MSTRGGGATTSGAAGRPTGHQGQRVQPTTSQKSGAPAAGNSNGTSTRHQTLTNDVRVFEWLEASRARFATGERANWTCLFGAERCTPKVLSVKQRVKEHRLRLKELDRDVDDDGEEDKESNSDASHRYFTFSPPSHHPAITISPSSDHPPTFRAF